MKKKLKGLLITAVLLFISVTTYRYYNNNTSALETARLSSGSSLIKSEVGTTRYQVFGEKNTPTIILIHSFNGFMETWEPNINELVNAGYKVVAYDLFGRGLSDRPYINYDLSLFRNQLDLVLNQVGAKNVHLIGSSFGCVIASDYAIHHSERIDSLVMLGPAGWPKEGGRSPLLDLPIVSDFIFHYFGKNILKPKVEAYLFNLKKHNKWVEKWSQFAGYSGFTRSSLSTLRHSPVFDYINGWKTLGRLNKPTLFIWGKRDVSFPFSNTKKLSKLIPHAKVIGVDDAAHWVNIEQSQQVNDAILNFLVKN